LKFRERILKNFDNDVGEFTGSQERPRDAERANFWQGAKPFLYPIARFAAHLILKFPLMEFQNLHHAPPEVTDWHSEVISLCISVQMHALQVMKS
jgi:hypothetical protein